MFFFFFVKGGYTTVPAKCQQQQVGSSVNGTRGRLSEINATQCRYFFSAWKLRLFYTRGGRTENESVQNVKRRTICKMHFHEMQPKLIAYVYSVSFFFWKIELPKLTCQNSTRGLVLRE